MVRVKKRNGDVVQFNMNNIIRALEKCYLGTFKTITAKDELQISEITNSIYLKHIQPIATNEGSNTIIDIEHIQNYVICTLIEYNLHKLAEHYSEYRLKQKEFRDTLLNKTITVLDNNESVEISINSIYKIIKDYITTYQKHYNKILNVDVKKILTQFKTDCYKGMPKDKVLKTLAISTGVFTEINHDYSILVGLIYNHQIYTEVLGEEYNEIEFNTCNQYTPKYFLQYLDKAVELGLMDSRLRHTGTEVDIFDFKSLEQSICPERDFLLHRHGATTLYEKYLLKDISNDVKIETYQFMYMRIAMGLSLLEDNPTARAIEFYNVISQHLYSPSTPTLFNSGLVRPQLSSCYVNTVPDDLIKIFNSYSQDAQLSKYAGGVGSSWTSVRSLGSIIKGTNGRSQGVIPFLKIANDVALAVNQGGKRKGAICAYLETWHGDIEEFITLRKETGDDRRRTHDMNTANWIPDLFMKRVLEKKHWTLFSPSDTPNLHDLYGTEFEEEYLRYEELAKEKKIPSKQIEALTLWRGMLSMLYETGHPWIVFKDTINYLNPQKHVGVVHSSNLCTEITLNTSEEEIAVCNLGSIVLSKFIKVDNTGQKVLDIIKLKDVVESAVRMLDNTVDAGFYPVEEANNSNMKHRPLGLGYMGLQDLLFEFKIPFDTPEAMWINAQLSSIIQHIAHNASVKLGEEKGSYSTYAGSKWENKYLGNDNFNQELNKEEYASIDPSIYKKYNYYIENSSFYSNVFNNDSGINPIVNFIYHDILKLGVEDKSVFDIIAEPVYKTMRNSNVTSVAPTATIANIVGVTPSIEPIYKNIYVKSDLCGEFITVNKYLVNDLTELGLWDQDMLNAIKYAEGDIQNIPNIPDNLKRLYKCAHQIDPVWYIYNAAARQPYIDQSQSLNLFIAEPNGKLLHETYMLAWLLNLKSTYYLRSLGERTLEKSVDSNIPKMCSIDDPTCESCQ